MTETLSLTERWETHTWDGDRCAACDASEGSHASIHVCAPERKAKGLAVLVGEFYPVTTLTAMADLERTAEKIQRLEAELAQAKVERDALVAKALEEGATVRKVAAIAGVSKSRVDQIRRGVYK